MLAVLPRPRRVYLSGRLFRTPILGERLKGAVERLLGNLGVDAGIAEVDRLGVKTKEGATGAAILASGIAGGRYTWVIDSLRVEASRGSIFDYILLSGGVAEAVKREFRRC